jgi:hypothetical protein
MRTVLKRMCNIVILNCINNSCIWNTCITWQDIVYKLSKDKTISVETCRSVIICEVIVHWLDIVQNDIMTILPVCSVGRFTVHFFRHVTTARHQFRSDRRFFFTSVKGVNLQNFGICPNKRTSWVPQWENAHSSVNVTVPFCNRVQQTALLQTVVIT